MELWYVGQYRSGEIPNIVWEFQGIFDTEQKAIDACINFRYFYIKIKLNEIIPDETIIINAIYPIKEHEIN